MTQVGVGLGTGVGSHPALEQSLLGLLLSQRL